MKHVVTEPGPPFFEARARRRKTGRIGGAVGLGRDRASALAALATELGPGAQVLDGGASPLSFIAADTDACTSDGAPLDDPSSWLRVLSDGALADVRGPFALAWRAPDGSLCLARDGIGERTLFYARTASGLLFASTVRALLATGLVEPRLDPLAVSRYLTYAYLPGRATLVTGVHEVLPGELVRHCEGTVSSERFWCLPAEAPAPSADEQTLRHELRSRLEDAVRRRLPPGETVGVTLSGGVDSSLVVALASRLHDAPVRTYSITFGEPYPNELAHSSLVASHCRTEHCVVELPARTILRHLDETIGLLSDPIGDPLTVPNALVFREASREVGVVLNGEGGDPCFGGPKNLPMLLAELFGDGLEGGSAEPFGRERSYLRAHQKCFDDLRDLLDPEVAAALADHALEREIANWFEDPRWSGFMTKLMAVNVSWKGAHHILPKVDAVSAPFGVLPRSPIFDRDVVDVAFRIPPQLKLRGSIEKYLLKEAVRDLLPESILLRPKSGMLVPVEGWFTGPLLPQAKERLLDGLTPWRLFRRDSLERLLAGRLSGHRPRRGVKIWLLVTLESWLRTVLSPRPSPASPRGAFSPA